MALIDGRAEEMDEQSVDYGNWVPKKMLIALLQLTSLFGATTFLPLHSVVRVLLGILARLQQTGDRWTWMSGGIND